MSTDTDSLTDIFLEVSDEETITERQETGPSRDPVDEQDAAVDEEVSDYLREDGLDDAVEGVEGTGGNQASV